MLTDGRREVSICVPLAEMQITASLDFERIRIRGHQQNTAVPFVHEREAAIHTTKLTASLLKLPVKHIYVGLFFILLARSLFPLLFSRCPGAPSPNLMLDCRHADFR